MRSDEMKARFVAAPSPKVQVASSRVVLDLIQGSLIRSMSGRKHYGVVLEYFVH